VRGFRESLQRFFGVMPPLDAMRLFSPLALMTSAFTYAVLHHRPQELDDLDARDAEYTDAVLDLSRWLTRYYFRLEVQGIENVPRDAVLLVGNHNGGVLPLDIFWLLMALFDRDGPERAPHILVHDIIAYHPIGHEFVRKLGFLRATQASAERALRAGRRVAVYPGADVEAFRPFYKRDRIDFAGHRGFARTAIRAGVPIVPVVSVGTHEQPVVLSTGTRAAKLLRTQ